jgi:hypothetical protein
MFAIYPLAFWELAHDISWESTDEESVEYVPSIHVAMVF